MSSVVKGYCQLPPYSFDGTSGDIILDNSVVFRTSDKSWQGTLMAGQNRYRWPVVGSVSYEAQAQGLTDDDILARAPSAPRRKWGTGQSFVRLPRSLYVEELEPGEYTGAVIAAAQALSGDLSDAGVFTAPGAPLNGSWEPATDPTLHFTGGIGVAQALFPNGSVRHIDELGSDSGYTDPVPLTDQFTGGEFLCIVVAQAGAPSSHLYNRWDLPGGIGSLSSLRSTHEARFPAIAKRFARYRRHVIVWSEPDADSGEVGDDVSVLNSLTDALGSAGFTSAYVGNGAGINSEAESAIRDFFNL